MSASVHRRQILGLALVSVLLVGFLVVLLATTLVTVGALDYRMANQQVDHERAFEAAQAGLAQATYNLADDASWGTHGETLQYTMGTDGSRYTVTFDTTSPLAWSTNNMASSAAIQGWGGAAVPPRAVMVMATGYAPDGRSSVLEAIFEAPPIPYAVAATGTVTCGDSLVLDGASTMGLLQAGTHDLSASLYAGNTSSCAVQIGQQGVVSGQLRTPGDIVIGSGTTVAQGVVAHAPADSIPDVPIQSFSTVSYMGRTVLQPGTYNGKTVLSGPVYAAGDIQFHGNLTLDNAVIYVDGGGSFSAQGNVHGTGSIFTTGGVFLKGNIDLVTSDGIAVFSQGALQLMGGNYFQGLLYSHQSVTAASGMNVIGAIACQSTIGGNVTLATSTHVTYLPDYARLLGASGTSTQAGLRRTFWREVPSR